MRAALTIARKDLSQRFRDRSIFIIGVIAPLALAFIFNAVFGGSASDVGETISFDMGVVDLDDGPISDAFTGVLAGIEAEGLLELASFDSEDAGRAAAEDGDVGAVFVLGPTLSADVASGADVSLTVVGNVDAPTTTQVAESIAQQFAINVRRGSVAAVVGAMTGVIGPDEIGDAAQRAATDDPIVRIGTIDAASRQLDPATYFIAGLSVFFLFFIGGMAVTSMLDERREGTLARLIGAPVPRWAILAGKSLASVVVGFGAMAVLVVASTFIMGADWGPVGGVVLLVAGAVLAVIGIMTLVGGFAKTAEQAGNLQSIVGVTLGMLGGTFVQIAADDGILGRLSLLTPNAWFLRGLGDMRAGSVADALPAFGALMLMAVVTGVIGIAIVQRKVEV